MNALLDILPEKVRKTVYGVWALVGLVVGGTQVGYLAAGDQPLWLTVALAVYGFVSTAIGATAAANTNVKHAPVILRGDITYGMEDTSQFNG